MAHISICRTDRATWDALVDFYRLHPGATNRAAKQCGVTVKTAVRAWRDGYDEPEWAARSIREILEQEQVDTRAALARAEAEQAQQNAAAQASKDELARLDATKERAREAGAVRMAGSIGVTVLGGAMRLQEMQLKLAEHVAKSVLDEVATGKMTWPTALEVMARTTKLSREATTLARVSMDLMRLHLGENKDLVPPGPVSKEERLEAARVAPTATLIDLDAAATLKAFGGDEKRARQALSDLVLGNITPDVAKVVDLAAYRAASA